MTPDTVRDYFLRVGASLRQNFDWLQRFPIAKQSELLRSGRFGIGTLAAYLLGHEVHVRTRHLTEVDGVGTQFTARLSDTPIELQRVKAPVGTSIRIPISAAVYDSLASRRDSWDWFSLQQPRVVRLIGNAEIQAGVAESEEDLARFPWRQLGFEGLDRVLWRLGQKACQRLWCNGILVENTHETAMSRRYASEHPWVFETADVMVLDGRGRLPLAVARDQLLGRAPYHDALLRDFLLDHCAWLLACAAWPSVQEIPDAPMWNQFHDMSPGDGSIDVPPYVEVEGGLLPLMSTNIGASGIGTVIAFVGAGAVAASPQSGQAFVRVSMQPYGGFRGESRASAFTRHLRDVVLSIVPATSVITFTQWDDDSDFIVVGGASDLTWRSDDTRAVGGGAEPLLHIASTLGHSCGAKVVTFAVVDSNAKPRPDTLNPIWRELALPAVIPRDRETRERTCGQALAALGDRVSKHLEVMAGRER
jgi:hypothetical protein